MSDGQQPKPIPILPQSRGVYCRFCQTWVDRREGSGICKCGVINRALFADLPTPPLSEPSRSPYKETGA